MWIRTKNELFNLNNCTGIEVVTNVTTYDLIMNSIDGTSIFLKQSSDESEIRKLFDVISDCIKNDLGFVTIEHL